MLWEVLRRKEFGKIWLAQVVSTFGDLLALFGVISLITFRWHGTVVQVTYVTVAYVLPIAFVGPVAGVFVDRWNVKWVMIVSDLIRAILVILLVVASEIWQIYAILAALTTVSSFFVPAQSVALRRILPLSKLLAANAMMSQAYYAVRILAPAAAGALVAGLSEASCFYLDAVSFLFSATMIATLHMPQPSAQNGQGETLKSFSLQFLSGSAFIFTRSSLVFVLLAMMTAIFMLSCFGPLVSIYVRDFLAAGSLLFGVVSSMVGVGLITGTQIVSRLTRSSVKDHVVLAGLLGLGIGATLLGLFRNLIAASLSTFGIGIAIAFVLVPAQTRMQQETPSAMMGRVSSSFMSLISCAQIMGLVLSGYLARRLGILNLFLVSGTVLVLVSCVGYMFVRGSRPRVAEGG